MNNYKISIPKPCTQDWDKMTKTEKGKHCASCNKVVIDFSNMSDQEMMAILLKYKARPDDPFGRGKKVCGNFYNTQIEKPVHYIMRHPGEGREKRHAKWPAIAAMLIAGMFQLSTTSSYAQKESTYKVVQPTSIKYNSNIKGNTEPAKDSLLTYSIKISAKENKAAIMGATVTIENIGTYTSDNHGMISFSIAENKIPDIINIQISASGYNYEDMHIKKTKITNTKNIELCMTVEERQMLRGDVSIEDSH